MPIDLTRPLANATNIKRKKFKPEGSTADLLKGDDVLLTLTEDHDGWNWNTVDQRAIGGKRFIRFTIYDTQDIEKLSQILRQIDGIRINGRHHKKTDLFEPEDATRKWVIEVQPTGR